MNLRILYVTPFVPWPIRVRAFNLLPRLARRHEVHLVALARSAEEEGRAAFIPGSCASVQLCRHNLPAALLAAAAALPSRRSLREAFFTSRAMRRAVAAAISRTAPDAILVERWRALQYVPRDCGVPVVCDATDSMTLYYRRLMRSGSPWERLLAAEEYFKFRRREPRLVARTASSVFCSRDDIGALSSVPLNCVHLPNGVDLERFHFKDPAEECGPRMIFWGNLDYPPNRHAVGLLLDRILPAVASRESRITLEVVGAQAQRWLRARASNPRLIVRDFAPDLRPAIARASVAVAPMTVGAGTSNKVLQALAVGTAIVATPIACGDLPVRHGRHLMIAESPRDLAAGVVALLRDPNLRRCMAARGRSLVERQFGWERIASHMEAVLLRACGREGRELRFAGGA